MKKPPIIPTPCPKCGCPLIIEATPADGGPKEIFCVLCEFHAESVEARETAQRKGKKDGKYHDLVTDMLARAIHSVGNEYADEIAAYEEERRMRRRYYEKIENRANGGASDDGEESDH